MYLGYFVGRMIVKVSESIGPPFTSASFLDGLICLVFVILGSF